MRRVYIGFVVNWANSRIVLQLQAFFRRHWRQAIQWRQRIVFREDVSHLILAGGVGILGGLVNFAFFLAIEKVTLLFLRAPGDPVEVAEKISIWLRVLIPCLGGLAAGAVMHYGLRLVGQQGSTNMLEVVVAGDGRLPARSGLVRAASSLVSIGTGASIGREGAITQMAATLASKLGQLANWPPYRLRLLVGCGAASGIAAAYNAPIAGAVFAAWVVLGNFSMNLFAPLVFASVISTVVSRSLFGIRPFYEVPPFEVTSLLQLPWFVVMGALAGGLGALFLQLLTYSEAQFRKLPWPMPGRLALSGLLVGLIAIEFPGVWGNGYVMANRILHDELDYQYVPMLMLGGLLIAKLLATAVTVGSGAVGGLLTPTLFLGASLGGLFAMVLHHYHIATELPASAFGLVGMGSVFAATTRSPLLAMILVFEISLDYSLMPALMLGSVVSTLVAGRLHPDSVYTAPLRQRGLEVDRENERLGAVVERTVGDLMRAPVKPVRENARLGEIADRFLSSPNNFLPVVDAQERLIGVLALQDLKEHLQSDDDLMPVIAYDVMRPTPRCVTPGQPLVEAFPVALQSELRNIPVVNNFSENRLVGALSRAEIVTLFSEAMARSTQKAA